MARQSSAIRSAVVVAVFAAVAAATAKAGAEPRQTIVTLDFEDIRSAEALKQRFEQEINIPAGLEFPNITFHVPEVDGAVARALDLISRQKIWEEQTVIRGCGPARELCFVIA